MIHLQLFNDFLGENEAEGNWFLGAYIFEPLGSPYIIRKALPLRLGLTEAEGNALIAVIKLQFTDPT